MFALIVAVCLSRPIEGHQSNVRVASVAELRIAVSMATPGTQILIEPGEYKGGLHFTKVNGLPNKPIVIRAANRNSKPRFVGGKTGFHLSSVSHVELQDLVIEKAAANGINIDDGGDPGKPSHHVVLDGIQVSDLPKGNHDGIKLSGVDDFRVENCVVERWGGSGIDMVGCHRGLIRSCTFRDGGHSGIQAKGGSSNIHIMISRFQEFGERGVNVGGSTGLPYFRPPVEKTPLGARCEARNISVEGCTFIDGTAPIAFVGVDGASVRFNTIYNPTRWALRILQETNSPDFVKCRNGAFSDNLVVFKSGQWVSGGVNIGTGTLPETFRFARNFWYCSDQPKLSKPALPTKESDGIYGLSPDFKNAAKGELSVWPGSPAADFGAHAFLRNTN